MEGLSEAGGSSSALEGTGTAGARDAAVGTSVTSSMGSKWPRLTFSASSEVMDVAWRRVESYAELFGGQGEKSSAEDGSLDRFGLARWSVHLKLKLHETVSSGNF